MQIRAKASDIPALRRLSLKEVQNFTPNNLSYLTTSHLFLTFIGY